VGKQHGLKLGSSRIGWLAFQTVVADINAVCVCPCVLLLCGCESDSVALCGHT
jgi:hypothetical protein